MFRGSSQGSRSSAIECRSATARPAAIATDKIDSVKAHCGCAASLARRCRHSWNVPVSIINAVDARRLAAQANLPHRLRIRGVDRENAHAVRGLKHRPAWRHRQGLPARRRQRFHPPGDLDRAATGPHLRAKTRPRPPPRRRCIANTYPCMGGFVRSLYTEWQARRSARKRTGWNRVFAR